jgi:hypothetical protein
MSQVRLRHLIAALQVLERNAVEDEKSLYVCTVRRAELDVQIVLTALDPELDSIRFVRRPGELPGP